MASFYEGISDQIKLIEFLHFKAGVDLWTRGSLSHYEYITIYLYDLIFQ